ncbi:MAG: hypothetical protein SPL42_01505 [Bacteroidales bacterium]|nr:hypothetical protein [Bacteroidales bacterium]MDY6347096.1 hypothetical protein [Bacteroidales bacterium]
MKMFSKYSSGLTVRHRALQVSLFTLLLAAATFGTLSAQRSRPVYMTDFSDKNYVDTAAPMIWIDAHFSYHMPVGMLRTYFKNNFCIGPGFTFKSKSNWTIGATFGYMFGANIRDVSIFNGTLANNEGIIVDGNGLRENGISCEGRYWTLGAEVGKIIPVDRWKNSGIWVKVGAGYFRHKMKIDDYGHQFPQLDGDYAKGYDRRSSGFALNEFVGYQFVRKNRMLNFYVGLEFHQMWTKPDRNYVFFEGPTKDMPLKFSGLIGIKAGWNIPLYERRSVTTYYYR